MACLPKIGAEPGVWTWVSLTLGHLLCFLADPLHSLPRLTHSVLILSQSGALPFARSLPHTVGLLCSLFLHLAHSATFYTLLYGDWSPLRVALARFYLLDTSYGHLGRRGVLD